MVDENTFFVCVYLSEEKKQIGHAISKQNKFGAKLELKDKENAKSESEGKSSFQEIFDKFKYSMFAYIDLLPLIAGAAPFATWMVRSQSLTNFLNAECTNKIDENDRIIYEIPKKSYPKLKEINETADALSIIGKQVPKMLIIGIVSSYEYYSSLLIREIYKSNAGMIEGSDKTVSIKDVFLSGNIDEFKDIVIDKEIEDVMRKPFSDQIKWFEQSMSIKTPIKDDYFKWNELVEIFERRNIFAHANGVVGKRYLDKVSHLNISSDPPKRGQELYAGAKYFKASLENITEFGLKLIQLVWRKLYKNEVDIADKAASDFAFELITKGEYALAAMIYLFVDEASKNIDPKRRLMNIVNLANCYALMDDIQNRDKILAKNQWVAVSDEFSICVAAVKGDALKVISLMKKLKHDDEWDETYYEEWPVFFHVRDNHEFIDTFEILYGRKFVAAPRTKNTTKALQEYLADEKVQSEDEMPEKSLH